MNHRYHLGILLFLFFALIAGIACTDDGSSPDSPPTPTPTPTPTPPPAAKINAEDMPLPSKEWLSRFSHMLSVVPAKYGPVLFLDLKEMRYKPEVQRALTAQMAPALAAIPSGATNVIEGAVLARDGDNDGAIVVLSTPLDIATMLSVASSLEISSKTPEPETFRDHQVWSIEEFGARLAIGSVDKTTSVAVAGSSPPNVSHLTRVKGALDTFDGLTPALLDSDALSLVANNLPQGVVVALFDGCSSLDSIAAVAGLDDCNAAGVSAELIDRDTIAINVVAGFQEDGQAKAALKALNAAGVLLGEAVPQEWAARQEGFLVRVRLIVEFDQIASAFDAFGLPPGGPTPTPTATPALVEVLTLLTYAQDLSQGNRRVLLRWRARSADLGVENVYEVYRRSQGDSDWDLIGETAFASTPQVMSGLLGAPLLNQLALDLRTDKNGRQSMDGAELSPEGIYQALLTHEFPALLLADSYFELALAMGLGFVDETPTAGKTVEYRVERRGFNPKELGSVVVTPQSALAQPANLRETAMFDGPAGLGVPPSRRGFDAEERYDRSVYDSGRRADGRVFLIWDVPGMDQIEARFFPIAGYTVQRRGPANQNRWEFANPPDKAGGHRLITVGYSNDAFASPEGSPVDASKAAFFEDDLKSIFAGQDPNDIYAQWQYKVCPVDLFGNEGICSDSLQVQVLELDPPAAVQDISVTNVPGGPDLNVSWNYSDATEVSTPVTFTVVTSPDALRPMTEWEDLTPEGIVAENIDVPVSLSLNHQPDMGVPQWYRVQVRDDAGNWSPLSVPVYGAVFPETPPRFAPIPHDADDCSANEWPLNLNNLDPRVRQLAVYRALQRDGHWQLIRRIRVENRGAAVYDGYEPPYGVDIYYRIEALDGHGNVSGMQDYCVHTGSDGLPAKPAIKVVGIPGETVLTETLTPTADSYVDSSEPDANFGEGKTIQVGSEASEVYRAFLNFDLSGIPEGSVVKSATLLLQSDTAHAAVPYDIAVRQVSVPWMESTVTWNNRPASQPTGSVARVDGEATKFTWNVTELAQTWIDDAQNNGLALRAVTENTGADLFHEFGARTPRLFATQQVPNGASPKLIIVYTQRPEVTVNYGDPTPEFIEVTVILPGEDGNTTTTTTTDENVEAFEVPPGATVQLTVRGVNINGSGPGDAVLVRNVNNFLNTNRHMANLGPIFGLEWREAGPEPGDPGPSVNLHFKYIGNGVPLPPVAAFRQAGDGSWMQVTPVLGPEKFSVGGFFNGVNTWFITDVADPSRDQAYNYSVLAFSPTSYEVLGFWESTPLAAQQQTSEPAWVSDRLAPTAEFPNCAFQLRLPNEVPWGTSTILLENGWQIQVGSYRVYQNCPGIVSDIDHLYGQGRLQAGAGGDSWTILFSDVATNATGNLTRGRILLAGDGLDRTLDDRFATHIGRIEFSPGEVNAEAIVELPSNVKLTNPDQGRRSNRVFGVVKNVQTNLSHDDLTVKTANDCGQDDPGGIYLMDEDLPWRVYAGTFAVSRGTMTLQGDVCTRDRLGYKAPSIVQPLAPDNNLGFMRLPYKSENATVTGDGLNGTFTTNSNIAYATSLPASVAVLAKGAEVEIKNSRIRSGNLFKAEVVLDYFDQGTDTSKMAGQLVFRGHLPSPHGQGIPGTSIRRLNAFPGGDQSLAIGKNGILNGDVSMLDDRVGWPSFEAVTRSLTFFAAAVAFPDDLSAQSQDLNAPMPAENAWRQLPGPFNGDLDPGFNIIRLHEDDDVTYDCYARTFEDTDLDLYVRRGGVSENLRINGAELGQIRDASGYLITFVKFDVLLVDNAIIEQDAQLKFYLPYPSDVDISLTVTGFSGNCPAKGEIDPGETLFHKYWNLQVIPDGRVDFVQTPKTRRPYIEHLVSIGVPQQEADATVPKSIMTLTGQAEINGLVQNRENPSESAVLPVTLEWMPDGDYGRISRVSPPDLDNYWVSGVSYALTGIKLSHYHQFLMRQDALPDTAGLELPATAQPLPSHLLLDGQFSQASLKACSERGDGVGVGCGFVILEGEGAVKYFGGIRVSDKPDTKGLFRGETPEGSWPLAINLRPGSTMFQAPIKWPELSWAWAFDDDYLDLDVPIVFLANSQGGVLAGMNPDSGLLPDAPVAGTPVGLVFAADFGRETEDDLGIFVGHSASMAVLRALAMRPPGDGEVRGWDPDRWNPELETLMEDWARGLGFRLVVSGGDDVVDLAREIWPAWENRSFQAASVVMEPVARGETDLNLDDFFGIAGVTSDEILEQSSTSLKNGLGQAVFVTKGGDFIPDQLSMDTQMNLNMGGIDLFNADWLPFELTKHKQFIFRFEDLPTDMGGVLGSGARATGILTVGTQPGNIGVDGGLNLKDLKMSQVDIEGFGAVFGAGEIDSHSYFYLGGEVKGDWDGYGVGGALLFGTIVPSNQAIQEVGSEMGLGDLLAKFGERHHGPDGHTWSGAYMAVSGEFPIVQYGCLVKVGLNGELQVWYFGGDPNIYGGQIRGSVYGELGCLISARGRLELAGEQLAENGEAHGRICPDDGNPNHVRSCTSFFGGFGFAAGIGFCSPGSWGEWERRWWGDSYCWQFGAEVELNYLSPAPAGEDTWENDIDWAAE